MWLKSRPNRVIHKGGNFVVTFGVFRKLAAGLHEYMQSRLLGGKCLDPFCALGHVKNPLRQVKPKLGYISAKTSFKFCLKKKLFGFRVNRLFITIGGAVLRR